MAIIIALISIYCTILEDHFECVYNCIQVTVTEGLAATEEELFSAVQVRLETVDRPTRIETK